VIRQIWEASAFLDGWFVGKYLLMPDHAHLFAKPAAEAKPLPEWVKTWKSISSRRLSRQLQVLPPVWQRDYFDHFIRSAASYSEKWHYVEYNPVRRGLCTKPDGWPYQGEIHDLAY
jgi:putative transposase